MWLYSQQRDRTNWTSTRDLKDIRWRAHTTHISSECRFLVNIYWMFSLRKLWLCSAVASDRFHPLSTKFWMSKFKLCVYLLKKLTLEQSMLFFYMFTHAFTRRNKNWVLCKQKNFVSISLLFQMHGSSKCWQSWETARIYWWTVFGFGKQVTNRAKPTEAVEPYRLRCWWYSLQFMSFLVIFAGFRVSHWLWYKYRWGIGCLRFNWWQFVHLQPPDLACYPNVASPFRCVYGCGVSSVIV